MQYQLEIRAGEGGDDAKLFVTDLMNSYIKWFNKENWKWQGLTQSDGQSTIIVEATRDLELEAGALRVQRVPPTEKRGRVHTSTVTVAVMPLASLITTTVIVDPKDVRTEWFSGTGKGGQKRNKSQSCCRLIHIPTGISVTQQGRSRKHNYNIALEEMTKRLNDNSDLSFTNTANAMRQNQIKSGGRDEKAVTIRMQDDMVISHNSGKRMSAQKYMKGFMHLLH